MPDNQRIEQRTGYWRMVAERALQSAWKDAGMKTKTITVLALIVIAALSGLGAYFGRFSYPFFATQFTAAVAGIITFWVSLIVLAVLFFVALIRIPPVIDQEKKEEIDRSRQTITKLQEVIRPKLEIYYDDSIDTSHQHWGGNLYDFRVIVKNVGGVQLKDITVKLKETKPATLPFLPVELSVTHNDPNSLNPSDFCFVNVLETHPENSQLFFCAKETKLQYLYPLQDYEILITASGHDSPVIERWFRFSVYTSNNERHFSFKEVAQ